MRAMMATTRRRDPNVAMRGMMREDDDEEFDGEDEDEDEVEEGPVSEVDPVPILVHINICRIH
jgi:hypothetical protein